MRMACQKVCSAHAAGSTLGSSTVMRGCAQACAWLAKKITSASGSGGVSKMLSWKRDDPEDAGMFHCEKRMATALGVLLAALPLPSDPLPAESWLDPSPDGSEGSI